VALTLAGHAALRQQQTRDIGNRHGNARILRRFVRHGGRSHSVAERESREGNRAHPGPGSKTCGRVPALVRQNGPQSRGTGRWLAPAGAVRSSAPTSEREQVRLRFERVNHGGTGWRDRLYLLKKDAFGENEVFYERQ
jgi:hypothetical protein